MAAFLNSGKFIQNVVFGNQEWNGKTATRATQRTSDKIGSGPFDQEVQTEDGPKHLEPILVSNERAL
jgi:hypothetical protein